MRANNIEIQLEEKCKSCIGPKDSKVFTLEEKSHAQRQEKLPNSNYILELKYFIY
jgi:hypothetical protein